ncbi:MAG: O-antigen ligase family protein [Thermoanaerobaculia bacterium]
MPKRTRSRRSLRAVLHRLLRRVGDLAVWAVVVVAPFAVSVTANDTFRLPKLLVSEGLGLASLAAFALAAVLDPAPPGRSVPWWRSRALVALAPLLLVVTAGLATTSAPVHVRQASIDLWIGAACLVGWSLALDSERLGRLVRALAIPGSLMALLGILQFHGVFRPFQFTEGEEGFRLGVTSLAGNPGDLGDYLVLPALAAQWGLARSLGEMRRSGKKRGARSGPLLWAGALAVIVYGMVATQTLTAAVALLAASAVYWSLALPARRAAVAAVVAAGLAVGVVALTPPLRERMADLEQAVTRGEWNTALTGRLDGWRAAGWMLRQRPWTGVGHGAYRAVFAEARFELQDEGVEFYRGHADPFFANAHNELFEAAAEWGSPGLLALAWGLAVLTGALLTGRRRPGGGPTGRENAFAWAALAGLAVLAAGHFPFRLALVAFPYLVLLAWLFRRADEGVESEGEPGEPRTATGRRGRVLAGALALAALAALGFQIDRATDRLGASKRLRVAKVMSREVSRSGRAPRPVVAGNLRVLREARRLDPSDVGILVALAGQYMLLERPEAAVDAYREALELEPRPEICLNLGNALLATGRRSEAREAFQAAIRLAPRLRQQVPPGMRQAPRGPPTEGCWPKRPGT